MPLKQLFRIQLAIQVAFAIGLAILTLALYLNQQKLSHSQRTHFQSYLLGDELRQSSDDLTRLARAYVATGNAEFERQYWAVLDIRNGKSPRPVDYNRIYWDLVGEVGWRPRPDGSPISLHDLMIQEGFTRAELEKLTSSQKYSDDLVSIETIAMNAVKGLFDDGAGHFTVTKDPDRALAMRLMNDAAYYKQKANIMRPIDEFYAMFAERTAGDVAKHERRSLTLLRSLGVLILVIMGTFGYSFVTIQRQIAERQRAEAALLEREQRYVAVVHSINDAIISADHSGDIVSVNPAAERIFGYTETELHGQPITLLQPARYRDSHRAGMARVLAGGVPHVIGRTVEVEGRRKDGSDFPINLSLSQWQVGGETFYTAIIRDISERKQSEALRAALEAQLHESQKMEAIGTLAGGVAHDFNNILAIILGNAELARGEVSAHPLALESLDEITKASARASALVQQILSFSRRHTTERRALALEPVIDESVRLLRATLPARLTLEVHREADVPAVLADATQIQQVVINLATNAMQAMPSGPGRIDIRLDSVILDATLAATHPVLGALYARRPGRTVRLAVRDTGAGMDGATLARIFEPFFTTKAVGAGTGLGLSVVHGILQAHEGEIVVESRPGQGATFTVYLPAVEAQVDPPAADSGGAVAAATPDRGALRHILYLDDEPSLVLMVQRHLERRGYRVSGFASQTEALAALDAEPASFDLLVTDYNMPGMSGLDVAREARAIRADLPVVVVSGYVDETLRTQAAGAGVRELIFKANGADELCAALTRLAEAAAESSQSS